MVFAIFSRDDVVGEFLAHQAKPPREHSSCSAVPRIRTAVTNPQNPFNAALLKFVKGMRTAL